MGVFPRSVIHFPLTKGLSANLIKSEMHPIFYETRNTMVGVKLNFTRGQECVVDEGRPGCRVVSTTDRWIAAVYSLVRSDVRCVMVKMFK